MADIPMQFEDENRIVAIEFPTDPPLTMRMNATDVDKLLDALHQTRASMLPEIPKTYKMGQMVEAIPDPAWVTEPEVMSGDSLLHLRDPGFGWLHYLLPALEAEKLGRYLQRQAKDQPPSTRPSGKMN